MSVNKTNGKHGHHIREYFPGTNDGTIVAFKKSNYSNKYKLQTKRGWSGKSYFYFEDSYMFYRNNRMGKTLKLTRISRSDVPRYIREDAYYKRIYVRD